MAETSPEGEARRESHRSGSLEDDPLSSSTTPLSAILAQAGAAPPPGASWPGHGPPPIGGSWPAPPAARSWPGVGHGTHRPAARPPAVRSGTARLPALPRPATRPRTARLAAPPRDWLLRLKLARHSSSPSSVDRRRLARHGHIRDPGRHWLPKSSSGAPPAGVGLSSSAYGASSAGLIDSSEADWCDENVRVVYEIFADEVHKGNEQPPT